MGDELREQDFDPVRIAELRAAVRLILAQADMSVAAAAREAGSIGDSTLSAFLNDKYSGNNAAVAVKLQRWMTARQMHASVNREVVRGPEFIRTRSSGDFAALMEHAQYTPDFSVLIGAPGIGKTTTARAYTRAGHNVFMVTCQPCSGSPGNLVANLADALNIGSVFAQRATTTLARQVIKRLTGIQSLVIIDEAQHLTSQALDQMRTFHDLAGCGVVLMGNGSIFRRLEGGSRSADYAQLFSRVGMRLDRKRAHSDDIEQLLEAWGIEDPRVRRVARAVARRPGALRAMTKVLRQAHMRARSDNGPVTEAHMLAAARQLGDEKPLELDA